MTTIAAPADRSRTATPSAGRAPHWTGVDREGRWLTAATAIVPRLAEKAQDHDVLGDFVHEGFDLVRRAGFLSMLVPAALGGGGATHADAAAVLSELAHGCPATALTLSMHTHLVAAQVWRHHRDLPAPVLSKVAQQQIVLVSTGASDWIDSNGHATRVDDGFRVSARKMPASGCLVGDVLATSIRWDGAPDGPQVIHATIPFSAPGVSIDTTWNTMGMRATGSHTVVLDDVFVPDASVALIRPIGVWPGVWSTVLGAALPLIMACYVGVAEAAAAKAIAHAGRGAAPAGLVGRMLNRLTAARDAGRAMLEESADLRFDNTLDFAALTLARKTNCADAAIDTVRLALEVAGGFAYSVDSGIERLFRDVHAALYHPLPPAKQERFAGLHALGFDPLG